MDRNTVTVFEELFHHTDSDNTFIDYDTLSTITGLSVHMLRSAIENLKESGYVVECERGLQITGSGMSEAGTRWID